jgi:hypothetical protein
MNSKASRASGDYSRWIQGPTDSRSHSRFGGPTCGSQAPTARDVSDADLDALTCPVVDGGLRGELLSPAKHVSHANCRGSRGATKAGVRRCSRDDAGER